MILAAFLIIPFAGAILCYFGERARPGMARLIALVASVLLIALTYHAWQLMPGDSSDYFLWYRVSWIPSAGIALTLGLDGMGFLLIALTTFLTLISVGCSWGPIQKKVGAFYFCLLWVVGGILGVFLAHDLFLFYFFWEMMLIPMYFFIGVWGYERRIYAAVKFFLFTFISGLFLLAAILGLYWIHGQVTGQYTFDYQLLLATPLTNAQQTWILAGFFIGFAVKLPAFGVHTWLPDAHTEAPTAGSIILAGLLLKTGAYGLIRFALPFCPDAAAEWAFWMALLGVIGIFYGAVLAYAQHDLKRLVAYSSVSHMGFVLLAIAANNTIAGQGAIMQMICHGLSTGALFALVGMINDRIHTRSLNELGGLWGPLPRLSGFMLFFTIASLGIPGLGNFIAELLALLGAYEVWPSLAILGAVGLFFAAVYCLRLIGRSIYGPLQLEVKEIRDIGKIEWGVLLSMAVLLVWLGLAPGPTLKVSEGWWERSQSSPSTILRAQRAVPLKEAAQTEPIISCEAEIDK